MVKTALIVPDAHLPFHNEKHYNLMLKVAKDMGAKKAGPDEITILGDFADFYAVNSHGTHQKMNKYQHLIKEIDVVKKKLDELDRLFPKANKVYICGNHEYRLERYIQNRCPELFGYLELIDLFELRSRPGWKYIKYGPRQAHNVLGSKLIARHEPFGPNCKTTATRAMASVVFGHIHQIQEWQVTSVRGKTYRAMCPGSLVDEKSGAFDYVSHPNWASGFGVAHVISSGDFFYHTCHIVNNRTVFNGRIYQA